MSYDEVGIEPLTPRESEVVALLMRGVSSNVGLSQALVISDATVRYHLAELRRKFGVSDRTQLAWQNSVLVNKP